MTIQVSVMDDNFKVKRGETIPLKVALSTTAHVILAAAIKKQSDFNKRFDNGIIYVLVFKDGTNIEVIPGTDPPEQFTSQRYKEVSGFGYLRIYLYLFPVFGETEQHATIKACSSGSEDETEELPPVSWLEEPMSSQSQEIKLQYVCNNSIQG